MADRKFAEISNMTKLVMVAYLFKAGDVLWRAREIPAMQTYSYPLSEGVVTVAIKFKEPLVP